MSSHPTTTAIKHNCVARTFVKILIERIRLDWAMTPDDDRAELMIEIALVETIDRWTVSVFDMVRVKA